MKRIHLIATGGAVMHNLAIVLHRKGYLVSGSDDKIADPARTNLLKEGILPKEEGFFPEKIESDIDAVILGMHAREDNPELLKAQELGIPVYSFPSFVYELSRDKTRVVIGGSHGKTSITAMVMHILKSAGMDFDYLVGAKVPGFDTSVRLSADAPVIVLEGDEYLASPIHRESKFLFYKAQIGLVSGIAWDHINVFPEYEGYVRQFSKFMESIQEGGKLIYCAEDPEVLRALDAAEMKAGTLPYSTPAYLIENGKTRVSTSAGEHLMEVFGAHNMQNMAGAVEVCSALGLEKEFCWKALSSFTGADRRLQVLFRSNEKVIIRDFAHSPSKVSASVKAVAEQFAGKRILNVFELHTFSSLNPDFLETYKGSMGMAAGAVMYDAETLKLKRMPAPDPEEIRKAFGRDDLSIFTNASELKNFILAALPETDVLLLMSSGQFGGINLNEFIPKTETE